MCSNFVKYLMVDVVTNHMGSATPGNAVDYSIFHPFNSSSKDRFIVYHRENSH